ncbi:unnamed protein product [Discosporangium mesarthrocarpum]
MALTLMKTISISLALPPTLNKNFLCAHRRLGRPRRSLAEGAVSTIYGLPAESTLQVLFHTFCKNFAKDMYETWIFAPTGDDLLRWLQTLFSASQGFPGDVGSTDVTHIRWDNAPASHAPYLRGKEGYPSIAYQVTVDHSGRALAVAGGFATVKSYHLGLGLDRSCDRDKYDERCTSMEHTLADSQGRECSLRKVPTSSLTLDTTSGDA